MELSAWRWGEAEEASLSRHLRFESDHLSNDAIEAASAFAGAPMEHDNPGDPYKETEELIAKTLAFLS